MVYSEGLPILVCVLSMALLLVSHVLGPATTLGLEEMRQLFSSYLSFSFHFFSTCFSQGGLLFSYETAHTFLPSLYLLVPRQLDNVCT